MMIERHQFLNEDVIINSFDYLLDEETNYPIEQIPIIEHRGKMIVSLDLLEEYAYNNNIDNLDILLEQVCYSSNIHPSNISLSIRDENLYSNRYNVDMVATLLDENVDIMLETGNQNLGFGIHTSKTSKHNDDALILNQTTTTTPASDPNNILDKQEYELEVKRNKDFVDTVKELEYKGMFWPRKKLAQLLAWIHRKAYEFNAKIKRDPNNSAFWRKLLGLATRVIEWITKRLHNLVSDNENKIDDESGNIKEWWREKLSSPIFQNKAKVRMNINGTKHEMEVDRKTKTITMSDGKKVPMDFDMNNLDWESHLHDKD